MNEARIVRAGATVTRLLGHAALFRVLGRAFTYPVPGTRWEVVRALEALAAVGDEHTMAELHYMHDAWRGGGEDGLAAEYTRLFLGETRCPLYETAYGDGRRIAGKPVELADVHGFYRAFGFDLSTKNPDLPDHLVAELEFFSLLLVKEAYAIDAELSEHAEIAATAADAFLGQHLGRWMDAFVAGMEEHHAAEPYRATGALLIAAVAEQCRLRGVEPQSCAAIRPQDPMQAEEFHCPLAAQTPPPS